MRKKLIQFSLEIPPTKDDLAEIRARFTIREQLATAAEYGLLLLMCLFTIVIITRTQGHNMSNGILGVALMAVPYAIAEQFVRNIKHFARRDAENLDYVELDKKALTSFMQSNDQARHYIQSVRESGRPFTLMEVEMLRLLARGRGQEGERRA